jgi:hypothetical protein
MKVPDSALKPIKKRLWTQADEDGWTTLNDQMKTTLYEQWVRDEAVGNVLSRYMDTGEIRVYLKDTVMKPYGRERIKDPRPVLKLLGIPADEFVVEEYIKPHGRVFHDNRVVCWGLAKNWKAILLAVYERAKRRVGGVPHAAVLMYPSGATRQDAERLIIEDVAQRLGVQYLKWLDEES